MNRIEGQLSLMVSHLEGEKDSEIAVLKTKKRLFPFLIGVFGRRSGRWSRSLLDGRSYP